MPPSVIFFNLFFRYYQSDSSKYTMNEKSPERRLVAALLKRSILDISGSKDVQLLGPISLSELMGWVLLTDGDEPYSFQWCCEVIGLRKRKLATWFVQMALLRKVELPAEPWGIRILDEKVEAVSGRLDANLWRALGGAGDGFYDGENPQ